MKIDLKHIYNNYYSKLLLFLILLLFINVLIDPSNKIFHLKYILFLAPFFVWIPKLFFEKIKWPRKVIFTAIFFGFLMPLYALFVGFLNSFIHNSDISNIIYFNSFFFYLLILIIVEEQYDLTKIFNIACFFVVLIIFCSYLAMVLKPVLFGYLYEFFVIDKEVAKYGLRKYGEITVLMIFYKTSPLLIFPLSFYLYQILIIKEKSKLFYKILILISIIITLFLSGTRANIIALFSVITFYIGFYSYNKSKALFTYFLLFFIALLAYVFYTVGPSFFNTQELSNSVKLGHLISYLEHFTENKLVLIFGQGLGNEFYSFGFNKTTNITELTYFELIRIWGLPISILFVAILIIPLYEEIKNKKITHLFISYLFFLFIAGTNPLLLNSTGMIVLIYIFSQKFITKSNTV